MAVTVQTSVAVVTANAPIRLTFTADTAGANFVRVSCTAAPPDSQLRGKLDANKLSRVHVQDADSGKAFDYSFDVSGAYRLTATEIQKGAAPYGGGYQGAPNAERTETILGESELTVHVASSLKSQIGFGQDTAEFTLHVADNLIRETTIAVHGRATPAIEKPRTDKAATAATSASVVEALEMLIDASATVALGSLSDIADNIIDTFNLHIADGAFHNNADIDNDISNAFRGADAPEALRRTVSEILRAISSHIRNDSVTTPSGTGSHDWHVVGAVNTVDWPAIPLFESSATIADHVRALADAWRAYEAHRASAAHSTPDTTNSLTTLPLLPNLHRLFLAELASLNPTVPDTENSAKTVLVHGAGFEEN